MKIVNQKNEHYTWVPARVSDEVSGKIDNIARVMRVPRHQIVWAAIKVGLSISPYELAMAKVLADRETRLN